MLMTLHFVLVCAARLSGAIFYEFLNNDNQKLEGMSDY